MPAPPEPASPCIQLCTLDSGRICLGCGRSLEEIAHWAAASAATKAEILRAARERLALRQDRTHPGR